MRSSRSTSLFVDTSRILESEERTIRSAEYGTASISVCVVEDLNGCTSFSPFYSSLPRNSRNSGIVLRYPTTTVFLSLKLNPYRFGLIIPLLLRIMKNMHGSLQAFYLTITTSNRLKISRNHTSPTTKSAYERIGYQPFGVVSVMTPHLRR